MVIPMNPERVEELKSIVLQTLEQNINQSMSEYDLLKTLINQEVNEFCRWNLSNPLDLFRSHFLLFHILYGLRDDLNRLETWNLEFDTRDIRLQPYRASDESQLASHDPMREYYLDLGQLDTTRTEDVEGMLDDFWRGLNSHQKRDQALKTLGLTEPVSAKQIKAKYKKLVMHHHPDRGGDANELRKINEAMKILKTAYY